MKNFYLLFFTGIVLLAFINGCSSLPRQKPDDKVIIGYVFPGDSVIDPGDIDAGQLTHINYAFANIKDGKIVEGFDSDSANYAALNELKADNPSLKILVSVGGWTWSEGFSDMALTSESRARFIESAVDFLLEYDLDGLDLDWEYPGLPGAGNVYRAEDKENFTLLLKESREALDALGDEKDYLLTIAAGAQPDYVEATNMDEAARYLDMVNLMTYDFTGEWDPRTGHHSGLFPSDHIDKGNSTVEAVERFKEAGVPPEKLVVGVPFYGRGWKDVEPVNNGLGQPGEGHRHIRLWYEDIINTYIPDPSFESHWDETAGVPYLYSEEKGIFITYEDPRSIEQKCRYIRENDLKGVMFWQYFADYEEELLSAVYQSLYP